MDGDAAADAVMRLVGSSEAVSRSFGWKDPGQRFVHPDGPQMLQYLREISASPLPELAALGREALGALAGPAGESR
jgi:hypothetical protein